MQDYLVDKEMESISRAMKARNDPFLSNYEVYEAKLKYENEEHLKL